MSTPDETAFYNVRSLRTRLREAIDKAKSGTPVLIGAHGNPEVVMTASGPNRVEAVDAPALETLLCLVGPATARFIEKGSFFAIPDNFGRVLDWLWASGRRDRGVLLVADLLADIRGLDLGVQPTYEEFLRMVRLSLTSDAETKDALVTYVDERITGYFSQAKAPVERPRGPAPARPVVRADPDRYPHGVGGTLSTEEVQRRRDQEIAAQAEWDDKYGG